MFACQWHIDIPFGTQKQVLDTMRKWDEAMAKDPEAPKVKSQRVTVGHIGQSPSHVINEYLVDHVGDWEKFMAIVATGKYKGFSDDMAKYIVPGSQHWVILKIVG